MTTREGRRLYGSDAPPSTQRSALTGGDVPVAVYGLGRTGLPLAVAFADATGNVTGVDVDEARVDRVDRGANGEEPGLGSRLSRVVEDGALSATADVRAAAAAASVHVIVVSTGLREDAAPDLADLRTAVRDVGQALAAGDAVFVESTVPPGTCREVVAPLLAEESGLAPESFGVAHCPSRVTSARPLQDVRTEPKVVGGVDEESGRVAELFYDAVAGGGVRRLADADTAECASVFETIHRDVDAALANELARFTDELGVDVAEAIDAANTRSDCDIETPGPGVGGCAVPYYPHYLLAECATDAPLVRTARRVNERMPAFVVRKLVAELESRGTPVGGAAVLVLGVAARGDVADSCESPGVRIAGALRAAGASVTVADPLVDPPSELVDAGVEKLPVSALGSLSPDAAVLVADHEAFQDIDWSAFDSTFLLDCRGAVEDVGQPVYTVGSG